MVLPADHFSQRILFPLRNRGFKFASVPLRARNRGRFFRYQATANRRDRARHGFDQPTAGTDISRPRRPAWPALAITKQKAIKSFSNPVETRSNFFSRHPTKHVGVKSKNLE